ncbi:MAG: HypC/HybG/HupF family hydrogenase formation chaperone [Planctomycetota bacterium]
MHLITAELVTIERGAGPRTGRMRVGGAISRVCLELVPAARPGDSLLVHAGVALTRIEEKEGNHVSRNPGPGDRDRAQPPGNDPGQGQLRRDHQAGLPGVRPRG